MDPRGRSSAVLVSAMSASVGYLDRPIKQEDGG